MAWKTAVLFRISLSILWRTTNFCHGHYLKCIKNFREKFIWLDNILQFPMVLFEKTTASFRDRISVWITQILGTKWSELDSESAKITLWISFWFSILFSLALKRWNKKIGNYKYISESSSDNWRQLDTYHHFVGKLSWPNEYIRWSTLSDSAGSFITWAKFSWEWNYWMVKTIKMHSSRKTVEYLSNNGYLRKPIKMCEKRKR